MISTEDDFGAVGLEGEPVVKFAYGLVFLFDRAVDVEVTKMEEYVARECVVESGGRCYSNPCMPEISTMRRGRRRRGLRWR